MVKGSKTNDFDQRWKEALYEFNKAIELDQKDAQIYYSGQSIFGGIDNGDREIEDCGRAIKLNPNNTDAYYERGIVYYKLGNGDKAIVDLNKAIELDPKYADFSLNQCQGIYDAPH